MRDKMKTELKQMGVESLKTRVDEIRKEIFLIKMKKFSAPEKNTALIRNLRKSLACALTLLRQKD